MKPKDRSHALFLFLSLLALIIAGCSGGTTGTAGTGDGDLRVRTIRGSIKHEDGAPLDGAVVRVSNENSEPEETVTDDQGKFELSTLTSNSDLGLSVETDGKEIEVELPKIDSEASLIIVDAQLKNGGTIEVSRSVSGFIKSSERCQSTVSGTKITFQIPPGKISCDLNYFFNASGFLLEGGSVQVSSSNCTGFGFRPLGNQNNGEQAVIYQNLEINNLTRACSIQVASTFPGITSNPNFEINLVPNQSAPGGADGDTIEVKPEQKYQGTLSLQSNSSQASACKRFESDSLELTFYLFQDNFIYFVSEEPTALYSTYHQSSSQSASDFAANKSYSGANRNASLKVYPAAVPGGSKLKFAVSYTEQVKSKTVCRRNFSGVLRRSQ